MQPIPAAAPLSRTQERQMQRLERRKDMRGNAQWIRSTVMNLTGNTHGVMVASAQILGHGDIDGVTYMRIRMTGTDDPPRQWDVLRRYNDFCDLRNTLGVLDKRVGCVFPQKQGFWTSFWGCTGAELGQRIQLLQGWLTGLIEEFSNGGDGRNSLIPMNRTGKLITFHRFFGIQSDGSFLPGTAPVEDPTAAVAEPSSPMGQVVVTGIPLPEADMAAMMAEPSAPPTQTFQEEEAELMAVLEASRAAHDGEEARLKADEEAQLQADLEAIRKAEEQEAARLKAEEEARQKQAEEEAIRMALEESARLKAEEEARVKAEQEALEAERLKALEEEARLKAEEEARIKAEQEEAMRKAAEEERLKAEEEARIKAEKEKSWLQRAVDLENKARGLEAEGKIEEALPIFNNCVELLKLIIKQEKNAKVIEMIQTRHDQVKAHMDGLWAALAKAKLDGTASGSPALAADAAGYPAQGAAAALPTAPQAAAS